MFLVVKLFDVVVEVLQSREVFGHGDAKKFVLRGRFNGLQN